MICSSCSNAWQEAAVPLAISCRRPSVGICARCATVRWDQAHLVEPVVVGSGVPPEDALPTHWADDGSNRLVVQADDVVWIQPGQARAPAQTSGGDGECCFCGRDANDSYALGTVGRICFRCVQAARLVLQPEKGVAAAEVLYEIVTPDGGTSRVSFPEFMEHMVREKPR